MNFETPFEIYVEISVPSDYWNMNAVSDTGAPYNWSRFGITVLGREVMTIMKYDPGDYGQVNELESKIENICRTEWFHKSIEIGRYTVKIPSQVTTRIWGL